MSDGYIPDDGDIIWLSFDPVLEQEQGKRRPALVLSPMIFNKNGLCLVCPITSKVKGRRLEVKVSLPNLISGAVLPSQIKSLDWRNRKAQFIATSDYNTQTQVKLKLALLLGLDKNLLNLIE